MDRKYQVFVSSTYDDLQRERQEVMHVLLELDCIPSGMELFPAADEDQWSLIRGVIDECDYYIVVIAGRYGSIGPDGISYTEMEYRYAAEQGKPVIAFLHATPDSIPSRFVEETDDGRAALQRFRDLVRKKVCKEWTTAHELGSVVARSLNWLRKTHPGIGWVRGDRVSSDAATTEILRLRNEVEELETTLERTVTQAPPGTEGLSQGNDPFDVRYSLSLQDEYDFRKVEVSRSISLNWNQIFHSVSPLLIQESTESSMRIALNDRILPDAKKRLSHDSEFGRHKLITLAIDRDCYGTILVQLRALGLIKVNTERPRSVKDTATYWTLTPYGNTVMNRLRAITRQNVDQNE